MSTEVELKLYRRAKSIHLDGLGADSTHELPEMAGIKFSDIDALTNLTRYEAMKRICVAQALNDNLSNTEAGLSLRWVMPDADFLDEKEEPILDRDWTWPANSRCYEVPKREYEWYGMGSEVLGNIRKSFMLKKNDEGWNKIDKEMERHFKNFLSAYDRTHCFKHDIIETSSKCRNDRKVMILFGVGIVQPTNATTISFCRGHVKTTSIVSLAHMKPNEITILDTAIMYKRCDDANINVTLPSAFRQGVLARDKIVIYGLVCEPLGSYQTG